MPGVAGPLVLGAESRSSQLPSTTSRTVSVGAQVHGLRQHGHPKIAPVRHPARVGLLLAGQHPQQG